MFLALPRTYHPMDRQTIVMVIFSLLLSAGLLLVPVNAEDNPGEDTSGYDLDISRIAVGLLDNDMGVVMSPPRWQWDAERYKDEGDRCAETCKLQRKDYLQRIELFRQNGGIFTPAEKEYLKDPAQFYFLEAKAISYDTGVASSRDEMIASCNCAQKYYNKAFQLTKDDDYVQQAEIFEAGTALYDTFGMTKEALQMRNAARVARAQAAASSFSLPLSPWVVITGLIGGLLLIVRKRE
jgi:hypothetical protein